MLKINESIIIKDIRNVNSKMSYNKDMLNFIGKPAIVISKMKNVYDNKFYYKLNVDLGNNTWPEEWLMIK